jgi:hypothetical protein
MLWTLQVLGLDPDLDTVTLTDGLYGFSQSFQVNAGTVPQIAHDCFLSNFFQLIIICVSKCHLMLNSCYTESSRK